MSELLTAAELAARLRVRTGTVQAWAREGRIPALRLSHKVIRYDADAVMRALDHKRPLAVKGASHAT
jgi:excisionase family DNA binding protein